MTISEILKKMILEAKGNCEDICHFLKVHGYAKIIGELEQIDPKEQYILEIAAIVHDIACPLCREKYGNANGKYQELEGGALVHEFFKDSDVDEKVIERVAYLVSHHHTLTDIQGMDYQILIEADYLVNADEAGYSKRNVEEMYSKVFKTSAGKELLKSMYL